MMENPAFATDDGVERILVVVAHPDDIDFSTAGSVAMWTDAGIEVTYCLVTSGEAGGDDRSMARTDMASLRRGEQTAAAKHVGVTELRWLGYPDGRVEPTLDLRRDISRVIREVRPQRVVSMTPERSWERVYGSHPDHLASAEATLAAVYPDSRNPFAHPELLDEGLEPWTVPQLWVQARGSGGNAHVDMTEAYDRKLAALLSHESQIPSREWAETILQEWGRINAEFVGAPAGRLIELFRVVDAT
jgi:LmbE family N-acetylglucosaminyl deacetylase